MLLAVKCNRRQGPCEIEPELVSAHLDVGMWAHSSSQMQIENSVERFNEYILCNVQHVFASEWLENNVGAIFSNEERFVRTRDQLADLFVTVPSVLVELERPREAEDLIVRVGGLIKRTGQNLPVAGALNLLLGSMSMHAQSRVNFDVTKQFIKRA